MDGSAPEVVTKGEFAALVGVSPGRVSQYISEGKISGDALVGSGHKARINVAVAQAQLRGRLDPSQRFGLNGLATSLNAAPSASAPAAPSALSPPVDSIDEKIRAERLRQEVMKSRRMAEDEQARSGRYMLTEDAEAQMVKIAGSMMSAFEGAIPDFAGAIASEFGLVQREVVHVLKTSFRAFRERASQEAQEIAQALPATVEDVIGDENSEPSEA